jgi:hypothetical protein
MWKIRLSLLLTSGIVGCGLLVDTGDEPGLRGTDDAGLDSAAIDSSAIDSATPDEGSTSSDGDVAVDAAPKVVHPEADFDGDGHADIFCRTKDGQLSVALSDSTGMPSWQVTPWLAGWCATPATVGTGKFGADDRADLYCLDTSAHSLAVAWSTSDAKSDSGLGASFVADGTPKTPYDCDPKWLFTGDFDGDGKDDVLCHDGATGSPTFGTTWVFKSNGTSFGDRETWLGLWCGDAFGVADFDGDHRTDVWCHGANGDLAAAGKTWIALSTGTGFADTTKISMTDIDWASEGFCDTLGSELTAGDFDGDGRADLLCHYPNRAGAELAHLGDVVVAPAMGPKGDGLTPTFPPDKWKKYRSKWCTELDARIGLGDFNGDGMLDLYCHGATGTTISLASSAGTFVDLPKSLAGCTGAGSQLGSAVVIRGF